MQGIRSVTDAMAGHFSSVEAIRGSCGRYWDMGRTHLEAARLTQVTIWLWIEKSQTATVGISSLGAVGKVGKSKNASLFLFVSAQRLSLVILLKINLPCFSIFVLNIISRAQNNSSIGQLSQLTQASKAGRFVGWLSLGESLRQKAAAFYCPRVTHPYFVTLLLCHKFLLASSPHRPSSPQSPGSLFTGRIFVVIF